MKRKNQSILLVLCLVLSLFPIQTGQDISSAASKPKLSKSSYTFTKISTDKTFTVKNVSSSKIKSLDVSSSSDVVASAVTLSKKKFRVYSYYQGKTTITVKVKVKKSRKKTKTYKLKLKIKVNPKTATPTPSVTTPPTLPPTLSPSASPSILPSASPSVSPSVSPNVSPSVSPSGSPIITPSVSPIVSPSESPEASESPLPAPGPTLSPEEVSAQSAMLAMKSQYPDGTYWTDDNKYTWYAFFYNNNPYNVYPTRFTLGGCAAFAAILSDAVFGEEQEDFYNPPNKPAREIRYPDPDTIRVGDIIRFNNNSHSAMIIDRDANEFTLAEGNIRHYAYNDQPVIYWGRKIPKSTVIDFIWTRW